MTIQGDSDPHPIDGLLLPLMEHNINFAAYIIENCGHTPWKEKYGYKEFYKILYKELETKGYVIDDHHSGYRRKR